MPKKPQSPARLNSRYRLRFPPDVARELRVLAAERGAYTTEMIVEIIAHALSTGHLPPAPPNG
jgi:hypothetical protein